MVSRWKVNYGNELYNKGEYFFGLLLQLFTEDRDTEHIKRVGQTTCRY